MKFFSHDIYEFLHYWNVAAKRALKIYFYIAEDGATSLCKFHCSTAALSQLG